MDVFPFVRLLTSSAT